MTIKKDKPRHLKLIARHLTGHNRQSFASTMPNDITCPSGLTGHIRGMEVGEERILQGRALAQAGGQVDALLKVCWVETTDPGPYAFLNEVEWDKILMADRTFALLRIRELTFGSKYSFRQRCKSIPCQSQLEGSLDLNDLPVRYLENEHRQAFKNGNRFETKLPVSGARVWFKLLIGADENRLTYLRRWAADCLLSSMMDLRVVEVEGVKAQDKVRFLENLSMCDISFLADELERMDFGIDTTIEVECPDCHSIQVKELPFAWGFFVNGMP